MDATYEYGPFGQIVADSGAEKDNNKYRFSTKYMDDETGLYYYGHRYYSPELGRYNRVDPVYNAWHDEFISNVTFINNINSPTLTILAINHLNYFVYANSNSINYIDQFGLINDCEMCYLKCALAMGVICLLVGVGASILYTPVIGFFVELVCIVVAVLICLEDCKGEC